MPRFSSKTRSAVRSARTHPNRSRIATAAFRATDPFAVSHSHFWCDTADGVRLAGTMLGKEDSRTALVLVHGFMGFRSKPKSRVLAEALGESFRIFAFDLRGHGQSGGACTGGAEEDLDVQAVVDFARKRGYERVVTVGWSLGGISVLRHAATFGGVDGVVAISAPSRWGSDSKAVKRTTWLFLSPVGRSLVRRIMGTKINLRMDMPPPPIDVVASIAPAPLLIVHGSDDHFFGPESATELYEAAGEPKHLILFDKFGHAEDGFTPEFARQIASEIETMLAKVASPGA